MTMDIQNADSKSNKGEKFDAMLLRLKNYKQGSIRYTKIINDLLFFFILKNIFTIVKAHEKTLSFSVDD